MRLPDTNVYLLLGGLAVIAYLCGSIPFGVIVARSKGVDIFSVGSGNIGATNVSRALGKWWGGAVFGLDVLKGAAPVLLARLAIPFGLVSAPLEVVWFLIGIFAVLGHCFSPWLRFRGGKGIATLLGVGLAATPVIALGGFGIFLVVLGVTRYVSFASMVAVAGGVALGWFVPGEAHELVPIYFVLLAFVIYLHRKNIRRLLSGEEPKFPGSLPRK